MKHNHHDAMDDGPAPGRYCSSCDEETESGSDDGPLLAYKYNTSRNYDERSKASRRRRGCSGCSLSRRLFSLCAIICLLCIILYVPLYLGAIEQLPIPESGVDGWTLGTNRDTKVYIQPNITTTIINPRILCQRNDMEKLYLLIIVTSAPKHFDRRHTIRNTWANYDFYLKYSQISSDIRQIYKNYNATSDSFNENLHNVSKRDISIKDLMPKIAEALSKSKFEAKNSASTDIKNKIKDNNNSEGEIEEFDMNKVFGDNNKVDDSEFGAYDYNYESNVMKIPPKGLEDDVETLKMIEKLKKSYVTVATEKSEPIAKTYTAKPRVNETNVEFKVVFILGLSDDNDTEVERQIQEEAELYGDIIQENFTDTYYNLTLKSIMMLKWVTDNCYDSVNFVMKTDDDMFINVVNLIQLLRKLTLEYEKKRIHFPNTKQYLLIGDVQRRAKPDLDPTEKWYSPHYMYNDAVYPDYLSGTGYVMSLETVHALYAASLVTPVFHLEDIYITGICAKAANPKQRPQNAPGFIFQKRRPSRGCFGTGYECAVHADITLHAIPTQYHAAVLTSLLFPECVDTCEKIRLDQIWKREHWFLAALLNVLDFTKGLMLGL